MCLIRNSSPYPVRLVSYQIDKTKFSKDGGVIYPGEFYDIRRRVKMYFNEEWQTDP
ncbi:MAG: hypothetical protein ACOCRK_08010 [bacterium]